VRPRRLHWRAGFLAYVVTALGLGATSVACTPVRYARSSDGRVVTSDKVRAVAIGMSETDVQALLGPPATAERPLHPGGRTLKYGGLTPQASSYTVVWVHLTRDNKVVEVYSKLYRTSSPDDEPGAFGRTVDGVWESKVFAVAFPAASPDPSAAEQ
jgi:hypothetical protein